MTCMRVQRSSKFDQIRPPTAELAALERLKTPQTYNGKNGVATFSQVFLIRSFSTRLDHNMFKLFDLERLKNTPIDL